ncbi:MAG: MarR family winged helix-turn-helix transcriptional regulator [Acidimicrobiales bacterium]
MGQEPVIGQVDARQPGQVHQRQQGGNVALAGDLGWGLGVVYRAYVAGTAQAFVDLPGGPRGYQILSAAARGFVPSQLQLAQRLGIDRTVMTYLLDDLEAAGLIERHPDPADRRARHIVATEAGTRLLETLNRRLETAEAHLLTPLDRHAEAKFRAHLRLLATRIDALDPAGSPCQLVEQLEVDIPTPRPTRHSARSRTA